MENKSYYAILPANIRYDKQLPQGAKLLYAEITALCNDKGYCWATNSYFSELYQVSNRTIQNWLKSLKDKRYIGETTKKQIRYLYISINEMI